MAAVLSGFSVIWIVIGVGFLVGRIGLFGAEARVVMSRIVFFIAQPCLLFTTISRSSFREVLGPQFIVAIVGAFASLLLFVLLGRFVLLRGRSGAELMIGGLSASLVNSANLGFPIAAYVLGDVALAAPIIMFQLAIYTPLYVTLMDQLTKGRGGAAGKAPGPRASLLRSLAHSAINPMIVSATVGLLFSWRGWGLPGPVEESINTLAGAAIPLMLMSFGLSLVGSHPLDKRAGRRRDVLLASSVKLVVHPLIAYLVAAFAFGMAGLPLLTAVVMASLPSAQNVLVAAIRYDSGEIVARDTVLVTTVIAIPAMVVATVLVA